MNAPKQTPDIGAACDWILRHIASGETAGAGMVESVNMALTAYVENTRQAVPLARQRQILSAVVSRLKAGANASDLSGGREGDDGVRLETESTVPQRIFDISQQIMTEMSNRMDFTGIAARPAGEQRSEIEDTIQSVVVERKMQLNQGESRQLVDVVLDEMLGLGPIEPLLKDDTISDIMVNGPDRVYVEKSGKLHLTGIRFRDNAHILNIAGRIAGDVGRRIDEASPLVDARLADGSRVNIAIPPLALDGPTITIRKFPSNPIQLQSLVRTQSISVQMADFLRLAVQLRLNILISGGTGSGKTTLLNAMSQLIPRSERILTIEDAAELQLQSPHVVRFETRPPNVEGNGEITIRTLVRNALRMRPDRIIIGEVRGDEVMDLLQAMNTGHDGSMCTLHANNPREALTRIENMASMSASGLNHDAMRSQLSNAVNLVIQVARMRDGKRRVTSIAEVVGMSGGVITLQDIFTFKHAETMSPTTVDGTFEATGFQPKFSERAAEYGLSDVLDDLLR